MCNLLQIPEQAILPTTTSSTSILQSQRERTILLHWYWLCWTFVCVGQGHPTSRKMWICLYTCCATRVVHLGLVPDMSSPSFTTISNISHRDEDSPSESFPTMPRYLNQQPRWSQLLWRVWKSNSTSVMSVLQSREGALVGWTLWTDDTVSQKMLEKDHREC